MQTDCQIFQQCWVYLGSAENYSWVCNNGDSHAWQRKESSYREEEKVGRLLVNRVFDFSLTEFLPGTKRSLFGCWALLWSQSMTAPWSWFQILFNLKNFTAQNAFSSVRNWATPTYFTVHCLARLPSSENPQHFPCLFDC